VGLRPHPQAPGLSVGFDIIMFYPLRHAIELHMLYIFSILTWLTTLSKGAKAMQSDLLHTCQGAQDLHQPETIQ